MLTRTPEQIALVEASRLCQEFVDLTRDAIEQTTDPGLQRLMTNLIDEHERMRAAIQTRLRDLDDLPLSADSELEALKKLATRVKTMFRSERAVLLDERIEQEKVLLAHLEDALKLDLDVLTRACLEEARRTAEAGLHLLSQERTTRVS